MCANWRVYRGTPVRYLARARAGGGLRRRRRPVRRDRRRHLRRDRRRLASRRSGRARSSTGSGSRSSPPPTTRPTTSPRTPRLRADPTFPAGVVPTFRPDSYLEAGRPDWARDVRTWAPSRASTPAATPGGSPRWRTAADRTSVGTAACRPTTATRTCGTEPLDRPRRAHHHAALVGRRPDAEATRLRRHMLLEMARMACEDGLVMTLHPGVRREHHHRDRRAVRRRTPATTSRCPRLHRRAAPAARRGTARHPTCTSCSSRSTRPSTRASSRRSPASTRRCTWGAVVVPRRARRDPALPRPRSPRPPASRDDRGSSTTPVPSARSRRATTWRDGSTRRSSRGRVVAQVTCSTSRARPSGSSTTSPTAATEVFKL